MLCSLLIGSSFLLVSASASLKTNADCYSQLMSDRYSGYSYDTTRAVSHAQLQLIAEAGRLAVSSYNEQPWAFIICDRTTQPQAYEKVMSTLVEFNQGWAKNAPVLIVSVAATKSAHNGKPNRWAPFDTGAATFSMMLQATSIGLMAHQMGGFDEVKLSQLFSIPADFIPMSVMAIGYPTKDAVQTERKRKPLAENFFLGSWGRGFE